MNAALIILSTLISFSAFAATFDIKDSHLLGQYERVQATAEAEIEEVKIIYNNDNQLVLVRDGDIEYPLGPADSTGLIHQSEDECNPGSGDEPDCYYDANVEIRLSAARNSRGQVVPQIRIDVDRIDGYEANPDYSYQVIFNWSAEIEDAVPFYFNSTNPADLAALTKNCEADFAAVMGQSYYHNRACLTGDSFVIRPGIDPQKAFASLLKSWGPSQPLSKKQLQDIFSSADAYLGEYVRQEKKGDVTALVSLAQPLRQYVVDHADSLAFSVPVGTIGWIFVLDAKNGLMHRFSIFAYAN